MVYDFLCFSKQTELEGQSSYCYFLLMLLCFIYLSAPNKDTIIKDLNKLRTPPSAVYGGREMNYSDPRHFLNQAVNMPANK